MFCCSWGVFVFYTFIVASRIIRTIPKNQRKIGEKGLYIMVLSVILWVGLNSMKILFYINNNTIF